jgi:hypothetical protein
LPDPQYIKISTWLNINILGSVLCTTWVWVWVHQGNKWKLVFKREHYWCQYLHMCSRREKRTTWILETLSCSHVCVCTRTGAWRKRELVVMQWLAIHSVISSPFLANRFFNYYLLSKWWRKKLPMKWTNWPFERNLINKY